MNEPLLFAPLSVRTVQVDTGLGRTFAPPFEGAVRLEQKVLSQDGIECLLLQGRFAERETPQGYPDCFAMEGAVRVDLGLTDGPSFVAIYQHKSWWTRPVFGKNLQEVPQRTQLLIRSTSGKEGERLFEAFLAVTGPQMRADLCGGPEGLSLLLSPLQGNLRSFEGPCLIHGSSPDPYALMDACYRLAFKQLGKTGDLLGEKELHPIFQGLGWCTWDSLGQEVSEAAILEKMEEFSQKQVPLSWVLIDDGWSLCDRKSLTLRSLEADPERFPNGLSSTVKILKEKYHIQHVGVWQAMKGYWYGVEEGSPAHTATAPFLMRYPSGELTVRPEAWASFGFWNIWHHRLKEMGIDFVKVDGQGSVATMAKGSLFRDGSLAELYKGLEASVLLNFGGALIHCMGMAPENVWNRQCLPLSRSSDDYTPTVPGSILEHALQNAYDNVYQGSLFIGDWDMFWSDHEEAQISTLLRVISGGPLYVSDACGKTREDRLWPLLAEDGTILGCSGIARPTLDCLTTATLTAGKALKVYNTLPGATYVACFHLSPEEIQESFSLSDLPEPKDRKEENAGETLGKEKTYLVYDWTEKELHRVQGAHTFTMPQKQARLFQVVKESQDITVLGLLDKYISLSGVSMRRLEGGVLVQTRAGGRLGFTSQVPVKRVCLLTEEKEEELSITWKGELGTVPLNAPATLLIQT